ncbi:MAG: hypothetical protein C0601_08445 [Candidatus Muiribacterium halophilum]|uniref:Uncharacterized protein n=1 Tax=Muiribacterium halophilum TaxID=2053465 RepID=A0A2N5ZEL4_MUIH1|nr:MAG: hypothetical protein C0601_08445 [Candidatus Muirbacterium halophilum]
MNEFISMGTSTAIVGMSVVFLILILISIMIYFLRFLKRTEKEEITKKIDKNNELSVVPENEREEELIAVISAAVSTVLGNCRFRIKNIEPHIEESELFSNRKMNMWAKYGRMNIMTSHQNFGKGRLQRWKK